MIYYKPFNIWPENNMIKKITLTFAEFFIGNSYNSYSHSILIKIDEFRSSQWKGQFFFL